MSITARLLAGAVGAAFAWAGANKVTAPAEWRAAAQAQGVPRPVQLAVPPAELVLGVCLVVLPPSAPVYGLSTLLLLVFTAFLAVQVATGSKVPCACFGTRSVRPPGWADVLRNVAMMGALFLAAALN
ncbi:MAG: MauE/DoxX family redox-associated membrane protein [Actinomycetota bacterium]